MNILPILYQDDSIIAINKPAGMLVHRSVLDRHETTFVLQTLREQMGRHVYPIHRLDRPTSGVLLFAFDSDSASILNAAFRNQEPQKTYHAIVRGWLPDSGEIDYPLSYQADKIADRDRQKDKAPQAAQTHYRCLQRSECLFNSDGKHPTSRYSLVALQPKQGRKHQLRRHLKHIYHPIIGDTAHGDNRQNRILREHLGTLRLMLHAQHLQIHHPHTGQLLDIQADYDLHWKNIAAFLTLKYDCHHD
ncbi:MAG: tRNA pseudouridine(65) synthase TruC [Cardiobacteriaceae bacterium]|nr:tRNA pseudouridine(65) synthase TruC [Cardiobacteriaceae bacterium]